MLLYLHGLSSGDFVPALGQFLGTSAGLSAPVITRLTEDWKAEARAFMDRDLSGADYVYVWADGIHVNIRLGEDKLCLLVMIGVRADGRKELIALADGYRESSESWADLLRDCARRGMRAPVLAAGDGALGFWKALREVFPETREQRCWFHKIANVLGALPKSAHPGAKRVLRLLRYGAVGGRPEVAVPSSRPGLARSAIRDAWRLVRRRRSLTPCSMHWTTIPELVFRRVRLAHRRALYRWSSSFAGRSMPFWPSATTSGITRRGFFLSRKQAADSPIEPVDVRAIRGADFTQTLCSTVNYSLL